MNDNSNQRDESQPCNWEDCPTGMLGNFRSLAAERRAQASRIAIRTVGMAVVASCGIVVMLGLSSLLNSDAPGPAEKSPQYSGMACQDLIQLMPAYFAEDLGQPRTRQANQHLRHCRGCRQMYAAEAKQRGMEVDFNLALCEQHEALAIRRSTIAGQLAMASKAP